MSKQEVKKTTIIQFEGEDYYRSIADLVLFSANLTVNHSAKTMQETDHLLKSIEAGKIKPDLAIVASMVQYNHEEGKEIASRLRKIAPKIKIIAYSILPEQDWADYLAIRSNLDPHHTLIQGIEQTLDLQIASGDIDRS